MGQNATFSQYQHGVTFTDNQAEIYVWAPYAEKLSLVIQGHTDQFQLNRVGDGGWYLQTPQLKHGDHYQLELVEHDKKQLLADPASRLQPNGVHGVSEAVDLTSVSFYNDNWEVPPLHQFIIYELHVGTFTQKGDFAAVEERLDDLIDLGITAIEIMPVAAFPGDRNWGYDGVFPFAVQATYGGPSALQHLVAACHQKGLAVILDVVYNHFGPEGSQFDKFGPYFTDKHHTPWGNAINFDDNHSNHVRQFFVQNALMWLKDFHIDALRLDAVHAIKDDSKLHILAELAQEVENVNRITGRKHYLIAECDLNQVKYITPTPEGYGIDAQWNDDFHHALRVAAGQKREGYYADFNGLKDLAKAYHNAYVYNGIFSQHRQQVFGTATDNRTGEQFVVYSQNHDQVGNRMLGERASVLYGFEMQKLLAGAILIAPFLPQLFMGEEWGETNPFLYFVHHSDPELINAVIEGRKKEFKSFHTDEEVPNPQNQQTFLTSKLDWTRRHTAPHQQILHYYKTFIALRKNHKVLNTLDRQNMKVDLFNNDQCLRMSRWQNNQKILCLLNFSKTIQTITLEDYENWTVLIDSTSTEFGGVNASSNNTNLQQELQLQPQSILLLEYTYV